MKSILLITLLLCSPAYGQERGTPRDSSSSTLKILDPGISFGKPIILVPPLLQFQERDIAGLFSSSSSVTPFLEGSQLQIDLLAPLKLQMQRENELKTLRSFLGAIQLGGVVYLVYRRLAKHGLK